MAEMQDLTQDIFVPNNYSTKDKLYSSNLFNLVEGVGFSLVASYFIWQTPFVKPLKITLCFIIFILMLFFEIKGGRDYTLFTSIYYYARWKKKSKKLHLGSVEEVTYKEPLTTQSLINNAKTLAKKGLNGSEQFKDKVITKLNEFKEKHIGRK